MFTGNRWNYLFPLSFHSVWHGVIISAYTKIFSQLLRYNFVSCCSNSCISKISILLGSAFHFCEPSDAWTRVLGLGLSVLMSSHEPQHRVQMWPAHLDGQRVPACSRDVLSILMSSIGSPADCGLQTEFSEHAKHHHQCRPVGVK